MGAWGPGLYSDDVTEDVRGIYVDKLHRGKNGEQASKEMIAEFEWAWSDEDDAPVFWFAMADMQWNYGRLQEEVKKKALYYLDDMKNLQRWEHENPKMATPCPDEISVNFHFSWRFTVPGAGWPCVL